MISPKNLKLLKRQHYRVAGRHSAVKICEWTKHSLRNKGDCYKQKFYGIKSHGCCEMSPWIGCENKCLHCWRAIERDFNMNLNKKKINLPREILEECIIQRKKLLTGFGGNAHVKKKKWLDAQEPSHFAISLVGEPTIYPRLGEMIALLRKRGKTTFLVTNGLHPEVLKRLERKKQLPTQLYVSLNSPNREEYEKWHKSTMKNAWKKLNESLKVMGSVKNKTRTVLRMTLVRDLNMKKEQAGDYAKLIKKTSPLFVEVVGFKSVGFARQRLGYETMPSMKEIEDYAKLLAKACRMKTLAKHEFSRVVLLGKPDSKKRMKIKNREI